MTVRQTTVGYGLKEGEGRAVWFARRRDKFSNENKIHPRRRPRITAPTLLAKGELSPKIMLQVIDILAKALPNREVVTFQGGSHAFPFEKLEEFNSRALEFLEKHR